jgi:hypothetical protein
MSVKQGRPAGSDRLSAGVTCLAFLSQLLTQCLLLSDIFYPVFKVKEAVDEPVEHTMLVAGINNAVPKAQTDLLWNGNEAIVALKTIICQSPSCKT